MNVQRKLFLSYLVIVAILLGLGAYSVYSLQAMNDNSSRMYENRVTPLNDLASIVQLAENTRVQMVTSVLNENPAFTEAAESNLEEINTYITAYEAHINNAEEQEIFETFQTEWEDFSAIVRNNIILIELENFEGAQMGLQQGGGPFQASSEALGELREINQTIAERLNNENTSSYEGTRLIVIILSVVAVAAAVGIALLMGRSIGKPLGRVSSQLRTIAQGDLTVALMRLKRKDEIGTLVKSMNEMQENLKGLIQNVSAASGNLSSQSEELTQSAGEVKAGSEQIAVAMQEVASGSETQANNAGDLASGMETFAVEMQGANTKGEEIHRSSEKVVALTQEGTALMEQTVAQMKNIDGIVKDAVQKVSGLDKQSQKISKLVGVINEIAEQTNLLALNAAIEAARAGEHGKGFAVVADEVRKLAEQVSTSVVDITGIVGDMQEESAGVVQSLEGGYQEVEKGTKQAETTGATFHSINQAVKEMSSGIQVITSSLAAMASNSQEMNATVEEIAAVSEESAAGVEQTSASAQQASSSMQEVTASSEELAKMAEELNELVLKFKV